MLKESEIIEDWTAIKKVCYYLSDNNFRAFVTHLCVLQNTTCYIGNVMRAFGRHCDRLKKSTFGREKIVSVTGSYLVYFL